MAVTIYTDGGCQFNPGPGAWAFVLLAGSFSYEDSGFVDDTTNNKMELTAVIRALQYVERNYPGESITIYTDSKYVQQGISVWIERWKSNGWKTANKKPVKNQDIWKELAELVKNHTINWAWVPGHSKVHYNERCDVLVKQHFKTK